MRMSNDQGGNCDCDRNSGGGSDRGLATSWLTYVSKGEELQVRLVELAISILREDPKQPLLPVRKWALDVLDQNSDVKLPEDARDALMKFPVSAIGQADGRADVQGVARAAHTQPGQ